MVTTGVRLSQPRNWELQVNSDRYGMHESFFFCLSNNLGGENMKLIILEAIYIVTHPKKIFILI